MSFFNQVFSRIERYNFRKFIEWHSIHSRNSTATEVLAHSFAFMFINMFLQIDNVFIKFSSQYRRWSGVKSLVVLVNYAFGEETPHPTSSRGSYSDPDTSVTSGIWGLPLRWWRWDCLRGPGLPSSGVTKTSCSGVSGAGSRNGRQTAGNVEGWRRCFLFYTCKRVLEMRSIPVLNSWRPDM